MLFLLLACSRPAAPPDDLLPLDGAIVSEVLPNGLRVFVRANGTPERRAFLRGAFGVGSAVEEDDQRGVAHFVEHMAFNSTERFTGAELVHKLESFGMRFGSDVNAHTSFDETVYDLTVPTDDPALLGEALDVLFDQMAAQKLDPAEFDKERGVIIEEWRRRQGMGSRILDQVLPIELAGSAHADRLPIGTLASLEALEVSAARRFVDAWYRPDLAAVVVVGDVDPAKVLEQVRERFAAWTSESHKEVPPPSIPDQPGTRVITVTDPEMPATSGRLVHTMDRPERPTREGYRAGLVDNLVAAILNERLAEVSQRPDAPYLGASAGFGRTTPIEGTFTVTVGAREGEALPALLAAHTEVRRFVVHGPTEGELARAKAVALEAMDKAATEVEHTPSPRLADELVRHALSGEPVPGIVAERALADELLPTIAAGDVRSRLAEVVDGDGRIAEFFAPVATPMPTEGDVLRGLAALDRARPEAWLDSMSNAPLVPEPPPAGKVVSREVDAATGVVRFELSNGVRVLFRANDETADGISVQVQSPGGTGHVSDADYVAAVTAGGIVGQSGYGGFDAVALRKRLAGTGLSASAWLGAHDEGLHGSGRASRVDELFELMHLVATQPRFTEDGFAREKELRLTGAERQMLDPERRWRDAIDRTLFAGDVRHRALLVEDLQAMDRVASERVWRERFADFSESTVVVVGAVEEAALAGALERWMATLPTTGRGELRGDDGANRAASASETTRAGTEPKASAQWQTLGVYEGTAKERHAFDVWLGVLRTVLREELREKRSGVYGVGVSGGMSRFPVMESVVTVSFTCDPGRVDELLGEVERLLVASTQAPPDARVFDDVVVSRKREHERSIETDGWWMGQLTSVARGERSLDDVAEWVTLADAVDPAAVVAAAKRAIPDPDRLVFRLLPEGAP